MGYVVNQYASRIEDPITFVRFHFVYCKLCFNWKGSRTRKAEIQVSILAKVLKWTNKGVHDFSFLTTAPLRHELGTPLSINEFSNEMSLGEGMRSAAGKAKNCLDRCPFMKSIRSFTNFIVNFFRLFPFEVKKRARMLVK